VKLQEILMRKGFTAKDSRKQRSQEKSVFQNQKLAGFLREK